MPIQKGKRRKRPRHRGSGTTGVGPVAAAEPARSSSSRRSARPIMRRGWEAPLWLNALIGTVLTALGVFFAVTSDKSMNVVWHTLILLGYFILAGLYFGKAIRQYRARRQS